MAEEGPMAQISLAAREGGRKGGGEEVRTGHKDRSRQTAKQSDEPSRRCEGRPVYRCAWPCAGQPPELPLPCS